MTHLKGLENLGVDLNPPYYGEWPKKIGSFMLNFGGIELISYQYLNALESTRSDFEKNFKNPLGVRIDRISNLINASKDITTIEKEEINSLWLEAKEGSKWRNRIAHNPVLPTWKTGSDSDRDPPDLLGIPDMRQVEESGESDSISIEGMDKLIEASAKLAQRLHSAAKIITT